jgi:hypothetical protein
MDDARLRRAGLAATLVTGACLLGAGLHGVTGVDATLRAAAAPAQGRPSPELVREQLRRGHACDAAADRRT